MSSFDRLVEETKEEIRTLLRNPDVRPAYMANDQLRDIQSEICRMVRVRDPDNPLVIKLNKIADMYINNDLSD